ncbi:MAG: polysialyltransferase family glycosyltransferase [Saccharofermentanales bacterium]
MNRIFFTPNYHTLYTSYCMIDELYKVYDKNIILTYGFIDPKIINETFNVQFIKMKKHKKNCTSVYKIYYYCHNFNKMIKKININPHDDCEAYFFLDQEVEMQVAQYLIKKKFTKSKLFMVEEGLSLYWTEHTSKEISFMKYWKEFSLNKAIRRVVSITLTKYIKLWYHCKINKHIEAGMSPLTEEVICKYPQKIHCDISSKKTIRQQNHKLYNATNSMSFLKNILGISDNELKIQYADYLYLGGPYSETGYINKSEEIDLIKKLLKSLPIRSKFVIKPHVAEVNNKYNEFISQTEFNIIIYDKLYYLPVECLYFLFGEPIIFSIFSTALLEIKTMNPDVKAYALYRLAKFKYLPSLNEELFTSQDIKVPYIWEDIN